MKKIIEKELKEYLLTCEESYYEEPLVGYAQALDPLFLDFKNIIGDFHFTPQELFEAHFGQGSFHGGTVISWILPLSKNVRDSNRTQDKFPSKEWAHTRYFGENFNDKVREHMVDFLSIKGYKTVSPSLSDKFIRVYSEKIGHASSWSERHAAYVAGLGTFSLSDGLITAKGIAHRIGSIITELELEPTIRTYEGPYDYCLHIKENVCGLCIKRCPVNAITKEGHDKDLCFNYARDEIMPQLNDVYGVAITGCGLCQTKVPCEKVNPIKGE